MYSKRNIPKSLREQVWLYWMGHKFDGKCSVVWCKNRITPFNFEAGHNIPESKGGETTIKNLKPICASCNRSMSNVYSIDEYSKEYAPKLNRRWCCITECSGSQ